MDQGEDGAPQRPLWCRRCDERSERRDGKFVHMATGLALGPDGHKAFPTVTDPARKAEARVIAGEFGGRWQVSAWLTVFYALPAGVTAPAAVTAGTAAEMRQRLEAQERIWALERSAAARRLALS